MKRVIHIGDGKHIEIEEGVLRRPSPVIEQKPPKFKYSYRPLPMPKKERQEHLPTKKILSETLPGYQEWLNLRHKQTKGLSTHVGRRLGQMIGVSRKDTEEQWVKARQQVKKDMENIKKAGIDVDAAGEEALETTLELMRGPGDARLKLAAARQVLDWTRPKPATKSEVTLNTAEEWLATLAKENNGDEGTDEGGA